METTRQPHKVTWARRAILIQQCTHLMARPPHAWEYEHKAGDVPAHTVLMNSEGRQSASSYETDAWKRTGQGLLEIDRKSKYLLKEEAGFALGHDCSGRRRKGPTRGMKLMKISGNVDLAGVRVK